MCEDMVEVPQTKLLRGKLSSLFNIIHDCETYTNEINYKLFGTNTDNCTAVTQSENPSIDEMLEILIHDANTLRMSLDRVNETL